MERRGAIYLMSFCILVLPSLHGMKDIVSSDTSTISTSFMSCTVLLATLSGKVLMILLFYSVVYAFIVLLAQSAGRFISNLVRTGPGSENRNDRITHDETGAACESGRIMRIKLLSSSAHLKGGNSRQTMFKTCYRNPKPLQMQRLKTSLQTGTAQIGAFIANIVQRVVRNELFHVFKIQIAPKLNMSHIRMEIDRRNLQPLYLFSAAMNQLR